METVKAFPARILIVEDEPTIASSLAHRLRAQGYQVDIASDGPSAVAVTLRDKPDLLVLDVMLPGFDGLEVCRQVQAHHPIPVLMLTARDDETDLLIGLGVGADDYLTKPFSMREVVARVSALLRRVDRARELAQERADPPVLTLGQIQIDRAQRRVRRAGQEIHLTPIEFDLLVRLTQDTRTVLTRERLLEDVWDWSDASGTRTVDSHIKALRRKLGPGLIRTVHGVGYAVEPAVFTTQSPQLDPRSDSGESL
ncbi:MAG: response regulator transcription factor [Actinomycetota bacterium]